MFQISDDFQTPAVVAKHMAKMAWYMLMSLDDYDHKGVIEPTPGHGNLVKELSELFGSGNIQFPIGDFWETPLRETPCDLVVMNPPFSPVVEMERFVEFGLNYAEIGVIALLPWSYIINSERRLVRLMDYGFVSVTNLPRKTFPGCRVQTCIVELRKGYKGQTEFKKFSW